MFAQDPFGAREAVGCCLILGGTLVSLIGQFRASCSGVLGEAALG